MNSEFAAFLEDYVKRWLRETPNGRGCLARATSFEDAVDAVFELINTGFLKLIADDEAFLGLETRFPPEPPQTPIRRPGKPQ
jgi:hypothetical protein